MTNEERLDALEKRVASLEGFNALVRPLGPRPEDPDERRRAIDRMTEAITKAVAKLPVDRSARTLTDGSPVTEDHREIKPEKWSTEGLRRAERGGARQGIRAPGSQILRPQEMRGVDDNGAADS